MENASKALIIAGAILLAIVIISLGLVVVNGTRNTINNTNLSEQEIQNFNSKFTSYEGSNISGSNVNNLIQSVISSNQKLYSDGITDRYVRIGFPCISLEGETDKYLIIKSIDPDGKPSGATCADLDAYNWTSPSPGGTIGSTRSLTVRTGKNYTVTLTYKNGLVDVIKVK